VKIVALATDATAAAAKPPMMKLLRTMLCSLLVE
jgi:hypothetical protein